MQNNYSKISQEEYKKMLIESKKEKLGEDSIGCLLEGIRRGYYIEIENFLSALSQQEQKSLKNILGDASEYQSNKDGQSFKLLCIILTLVLQDKMIYDIGTYVIRTTPHMYKDNDNCNKFFKSEVIDRLDDDIVKNFDFYECNEEQVYKFRDMCSTISNHVISEDMTKQDKANMLKLSSWIKEKKEQNGIVLEEEIKHEEAKQNSTKNVISKVEEASTVEEKKPKKSKKKSLSSQLRKFIDEIEKLEQDLNVQDRKILDFEDKINEKSIKISKLLEEKNELEKALIAKNQEIEDWKRKSKTLTSEKEELESKLQKRDEVISIYGKDKSNSQTELLKSISQSLKDEYEDFQESLGLEMSVEMGEVYKEKMISIFKILSKNGINMED